MSKRNNGFEFVACWGPYSAEAFHFTVGKAQPRQPAFDRVVIRFELAGGVGACTVRIAVEGFGEFLPKRADGLIRCQVSPGGAHGLGQETVPRGAGGEHSSGAQGGDFTPGERAIRREK